jgi:hypothetical protein
MLDFLQKLKQKCYVGLVGGSDLTKIAEQMGSKGKEKVQKEKSCERTRH